MEKLGDFVIEGRQEYAERRKRFSPARVIPLSFILAIIIGTFLLMLPVSSADGRGTDLLTALFTATTAVSVTGLVVVDTFSYWSLFGKVVILILIQLGGLGIISFMSMVMLILRKRFSLEDRKLLNDAMNIDTDHGLLRFLKKIFIWSFAVEGAGAVSYMIDFIPRYGVAGGIWRSVFTAVSAFCNAGIDILGPDSMISFNGNPLVLITTMVLIILGGLGYVVWFDMTEKIIEGFRMSFSPRKVISRFGEHTKLVLALTLFFIMLGFVIIFPAEFNNPDTMASMSVPQKILNSFFQSVTYRTAGFASVPQQGLSDASVLIGYFLMFVGGSPIGTAGGVKTVTMFIVVLNVVAFIRGRREAVVFKREVTENFMRKASAIVAVSFAVAFLMTTLLIAAEGVDMKDGLFEVVSAVATVGLSRNLTASLHTIGRVIIIITMYLGRIGPISLALFFSVSRPRSNKLDYSNGKFYVG